MPDQIMHDPPANDPAAHDPATHAEPVELVNALTDPARAMLQSLSDLAAATVISGDLVGAHQLLDELEELAAQSQDEAFEAEARATRAHALVAAGRVDEGVAVALEAADTFLSRGDVTRALSTELWVARTLVDAARLEDAAAVYGAVLEEGREVPDVFESAALELAHTLEALGRPRAAARVRAELEG